MATKSKTSIAATVDSPVNLATPTMTMAERLDLAKLARMRERVARSEVDLRAAELRADVEQQLAATYTFTDEAWADVTSAAAAAVKQADAEIAGICRARGIPEEFCPSLSVQWYRRGENAVAGRRTELRKAAHAQIDAKAKRAKHEIAPHRSTSKPSFWPPD